MYLPLFPLNIIVFPNASYSLHIFEDRYKQLVKDCIKDNLQFGINYVHNSKMFDIGCIMDIVSVVNQYEDGKFDIIVKGGERYYLQNFKDGEKPYYTGEIITFNDSEEYIEPNLAIECIESYNELVQKVEILNINTIPMAESKNKFLSFLIAQKVGLSGLQKQEVIEMTSENKRLLFILNHIKNLMPKLELDEQRDKIIRNDGYFTNY